MQVTEEAICMYYYKEN